MKTTPEQEAFLADLQKVYEKHGMVVKACGCCDSPWIQGVLTKEFDALDALPDGERAAARIQSELDHLRGRG